jgi:hypothetical protein
MPWSKSLSVLVDTIHGNLVRPDDPEFTEFFRFLESKNFSVTMTTQTKLLFEDLQGFNMLLIGVPQCAYYLQEEIHNVMNFVRRGGGLLLIHRHGGDLLQKSDLNELSKQFDISFENSLLKDTTHAGVPSIPIVSPAATHPILKNVHKLVFPGSCTLRVEQNAQTLFSSNESGWLEFFNPNTYQWIRGETTASYTLAAYRTYGQGRVIAIGTSDFLCNHPTFGLDSLDHRKFALNLFSWLAQPVSEPEVRDWMLLQIGQMSEQIQHMNATVDRMHKTLTRVDNRLSDLEHKYYASKGIHIPQSDEENEK